MYHSGMSISTAVLRPVLTLPNLEPALVVHTSEDTIGSYTVKQLRSSDGISDTPRARRNTHLPLHATVDGFTVWFTRAHNNFPMSDCRIDLGFYRYGVSGSNHSS